MARIVLIGLLLFCPIAYATSELELLLMMLKENGTISSEQYKRVMIEFAHNHAQSSEQKTLRSPLPLSTSKITVKNGLNVQSADNAFEIQVGGRVEGHAATYYGNNMVMGDGTDLRRARLFIKGRMYNDWRYKLDYDFVSGSGNSLKGIKDAFIAYHGFTGLQLIIGNYKVPYSLEFQASSHANTFIERSLAFALQPSRHLGAGMTIFRNKGSVQLGIFGNKVAQDNAGHDEEWLIAGRTTWLPFKQDNKFIHLGLSGLYSNNGDKQGIQFKSKPESFVTKVNLLDTGIISNVANYSKLGVEAAISWNRFNVQGEYMETFIDKKEQNLSFNGWYIQSSFFLTHDYRPYKKGKYGIVHPSKILGKNGIGAWEVALRLSHLDLSDKNILGGEQQNVTIGINLYATPEIRFSAEYIDVLDIRHLAIDKVNPAPKLAQLRMEWVF